MMMTNDSLLLPVATAYDLWSATYDGYDNPMVFGATRIMEDLAPQACGKTVVEFGCGTGRNLVCLKQAGAVALTGCDLSPGMLEQARNRDATFSLLQQDMASPLPLSGGSVDLAIFVLSLEHVSDLTGPLREAHRLLRSSGECVIIEIHPFLSLNAVSAHFRDGEREIRMPTVPHRFSDYINACSGVGFRLAQCREWRPCDFKGEVPEKVRKRGLETPLLLQFTLLPTGSGTTDPSAGR